MGYIVLVLLSNIQTYMRGNQISYWFTYIPPLIKEYLKLLTINDISKNELKSTGTRNAKDEHEEELI